jgi:hypothetical protein
MGKQPIESINSFLRGGQVEKAVEAFKKELKNSLAYMFSGKPEFVRDGVITFFEKLVSIDEDFMVVMGPRRRTADGKFEHPTYHIAFDNNAGMFFAGFELKFVRNKYVKLVYRCPSKHYFDDKLGHLEYKLKQQDNYATVWVGEEIDENTYDLMAKVAYRVKCHYLGVAPSKLKEVSKGGKSAEPPQTNYLPTKADCETALKALQKRGKGSSVDKEELFEWLEQRLQDKGILMKSNWKVITERNFELWFS